MSQDFVGGKEKVKAGGGVVFLCVLMSFFLQFLNSLFFFPLIIFCVLTHGEISLKQIHTFLHSQGHAHSNTQSESYWIFLPPLFPLVSQPRATVGLPSVSSLCSSSPWVLSTASHLWSKAPLRLCSLMPGMLQTRSSPMIWHLIWDSLSFLQNQYFKEKPGG